MKKKNPYVRPEIKVVHFPIGEELCQLTTKSDYRDPNGPGGSMAKQEEGNCLSNDETETNAQDNFGSLWN